MNPPPVHYARTSDGFSIAYAVSGRGRPYVFLPGAFEHVQLAWQYPHLQPWVEGLSSRFQLIQIDERGAGMSMRGLTDAHVSEDYLLDLEAVVDQLNPEPFVLHAAATREPCAVAFALKHPERVAALVLGPVRSSRAPRGAVTFFTALPNETWDIFLRSLASMYQPSEDLPRAVELLKQSFGQADFAQRMRVILEATSSATSGGVPEELLRRLRTPTLVLHPRDYNISPASDSMMSAQLANATMTLVDGAFVLGDAEPGIRAIEAFLADITPAAPSKQAPSDTLLSTREIEVLRLIAAGKSNQQIAGELVISPNTVGRHIGNIFAKTGAANRTEAAGYARDHGLV